MTTSVQSERTEAWGLLRSAQPQCAAGTQSIPEPKCCCNSWQNEITLNTYCNVSATIRCRKTINIWEIFKN